jgi:thioredoxin
MVEKINAAEFEEKVLKGKGSAVIDCYADWCMPCKIFSAVIAQVEQEMKDKIAFYKINVDENPSVAQLYGIQGIPTTLLFVNGRFADRLVGLVPAEDLKAWIEQHLNDEE